MTSSGRSASSRAWSGTWSSSGATRYSRQIAASGLSLARRVRVGAALVQGGATRRGADRRGGGGRFSLLAVGAERRHGVHRDPDDRQQDDRAYRAENLAPPGPEPGGRPWPPEGGQPGREPRVLCGESPLYLREHPVLVHG